MPMVCRMSSMNRKAICGRLSPTRHSVARRTEPKVTDHETEASQTRSPDTRQAFDRLYRGGPYLPDAHGRGYDERGCPDTAFGLDLDGVDGLVRDRPAGARLAAHRACHGARH